MDIKEKPKAKGNSPKSRAAPVIDPRQAAKLLKDKYVKELEQRPESEGADAQAAEQVQDAGTWAVDEIVSRPIPRQKKQTVKEKPATPHRAADRPTAESSSAPAGEGREAVPPGEMGRTTAEPTLSVSDGAEPVSYSAPTPATQRQAASISPRDRSQNGRPIIKERGEAVISTRQATAGGGPKNNLRTPTEREISPRAGTKAEHITQRTASIKEKAPTVPHERTTVHTPAADGGKPVMPRPKGGDYGSVVDLKPPVNRSTAVSEAPSINPIRPRSRAASKGTVPKTRPVAPKRSVFRPKASNSAVKGLSRASRSLGKTAEVQMRSVAVQQAKKAAKSAAAFTKKAVQAVAKAASTIINALAGLAGGGVLLVALLVVALIAAIVSSPFGIFFAGSDGGNAQDTVSAAEAVASINSAFNARLAELQTAAHDSVQINGHMADWGEVLAVFAVQTAGNDTGVDVATLDADRLARLTAVFWAMNAVTGQVTPVNHPDSNPNDEVNDSWTEQVLTITITSKTADEMRTAYSFTDYQNSVLDELLADPAALASLAQSLTIANAEAFRVLNALPADLAPERREVVRTALMLYGKVNYFWGGKSLRLGWNPSWGAVTKVTAEGSPTTGTYRPYGLDCSGFVDWVFYNATGGAYHISHGGGAHSQHTYCTSITWEEALPGDLVFYPEDSHVGIVCGRDESGNLQIIHCSSGSNNVVITGTSGFKSIGRPQYFTQ